MQTTIKAILVGGGMIAGAAVFGSMLAYTFPGTTTHAHIGHLSPSIVEPIVQSEPYAYDSNYDTGYYDLVEKPQ